MAVRSKGRRKITCQGNVYFWHIKIGYDDPYYWLHVMAEDKHLHIIYPIDTPEVYYVNLPFILKSPVTPKTVAEIIQWAENENHKKENINHVISS